MSDGKVALFDLDGTLADYERALTRDLDKLRSPGEPVIGLRHERGGEPDWAKARRKLVQAQPGWWLGLYPLAMGFDLLAMAMGVGFDVHVLTKGPSDQPEAWAGKLAWCRRHLPQGTPVTITMEKALVYGRVLVDDWPEYGRPWQANRPRGLWVVPAQPWNEDVVDDEWTFRYSGSHCSAELRRRLLLQYNR